MSLYSDMRCIDSNTQLMRTYTVPKVYQVAGLRELQLRVRNRREEPRTLFSSTPDPISLRSERGLCQVYSRSGSDRMHVRHTHGSDIDWDKRYNPISREVEGGATPMTADETPSEVCSRVRARVQCSEDPKRSLRDSETEVEPMSTEDTQQQNRFGRIEQSSNDEYVTREELQLILELKELELVKLRQRVADLEDGPCIDESEDAPTVHDHKVRVREQLAAIRGESDE